MSNYYKTEGIVLASRDVGEYDRVVTCFTREYGRVELLVKAVRKITSKLRGGLTPFSLVWLEFVEGKYGYIATEAIAVRQFFKNDSIFYTIPYPVFALRDFFLSIVQGQEKDEKLFNCLVEFFEGPDKKFERATELEVWADHAKGTVAMLCGYGYVVGDNVELQFSK